MTSWILIIYLCTFLYLFIAWIFYLILKIFIWNCQWSKAWKQQSWIWIFFFFGGNWSVRIILVYANITRWNQSKRYILKLYCRRLKLMYIYMIYLLWEFKDIWYILFLIQINQFLLDHFIHTCTHIHSLTNTHLCAELIKKELWLNNPLLSDNGISYRGANMQKAIWKCILVVVRFYYAGRCHVCYEAECRWQSGRNGSLILTMINEQR